MSTIEKDTSSIMELYYAVDGLTALSEKLPRDKVDKVVKAVQSTLQKDDNLWKYDLYYY